MKPQTYASRITAACAKAPVFSGLFCVEQVVNTCIPHFWSTYFIYSLRVVIVYINNPRYVLVLIFFSMWQHVTERREYCRGTSPNNITT
jgi:hypothetical protein